jgi:hypothetical protein
MNRWDAWENRFAAFLKAIENIGGEAEGYLIKPSANALDVKKVEKQLGYSLPQSFVKVVLEYTRGMEISWSLPDEDDFEAPLPKELDGLFASDVRWSLDEIISVEGERKRWETKVFPDPDNEYDVVWHNKLAWLEVGNGDFLAFDLNISDDPPIVYLSHDDGEGHGCVLGANFLDFLDRWTRIGCVGCEDWQLLPFIKDETIGIDDQSDNAQTWRSWLKIILNEASR